MSEAAAKKCGGIVELQKKLQDIEDPVATPISIGRVRFVDSRF